MRYKIEGPTNLINVRFVTEKTLKKHWGKPIESIAGLYTNSNNTIWIRTGMEKHKTMLVLMHEAVHAAIDQLVGVEDEEARADALAAWIIRLTKLSDYQNILI